MERSLSFTTLERVKRSQFVNLRFKKDDFSTRFAMIKAIGLQRPIYYPGVSGRFSFMAFFAGLFIFMSIKLSLNKTVVSLFSLFLFRSLGCIQGYIGLFQLGVK
jgi:hypothetical protein